MFASLSSDGDNFYSPINASGYLTPLQRKKLREKRKIDISVELDVEFVTPKNPKKVKQRNANPHPKVLSKKTLFKKKQVKRTLSESRCIASDLLVKGNTDTSVKDKKFFKSRSPQHLKKAKFSMPMTYKKKRLSFGSPVVHQNFAAPVSRVDNNSQDDVCENISEEITPSKVKPSLVLTSSTTILMLEDTNKTSSSLTSDSKDLPEDAKDSFKPNPTTDVVVIDEKKDSCEKGIFDFDWPSDEVLLERQNKARLLMRKDINVSSSSVSIDYDQESEEVEEAENVPPKKLFPIFMKRKHSGQETSRKRPCLKKSPTFIKDSSNNGEQMFIDAGQKEIGAKVCPTCNMVYTIAQEEDEILHSKYHTTYLINLKFLGWKEEHIVGDYDDGRVILIKETDKHFKLKKVEDVLFIANRDLGFPSASFPSKPNKMFLLFISNEKRVCGCLVAESIELACPVVMGNDELETVDQKNEKTIWKLGNWYASTNPVPAICGINRIWVSKDFRRHKVGSRMLDCLRQNFLFGHVVGLNELAFTDPSPDGRQFAASYTKTNNFLVYK